MLTPGFKVVELDEYWHVFIDWNSDGDFNDAGEAVYSGNSTQPITTNVSIPTSATPGLTRMRITMDAVGGNTNACADIQYGEVEDYSIYID